MELIAVFSPFASFLIAGLFGRQLGDKGVQFITCSAVILAALASVSLFFRVPLNDLLVDESYVTALGSWIESSGLRVHWALRVDALSVVMMCVVNIVSACVHVYSVSYMEKDPAQARFMTYLSLFTFAMLMLVSADNALQLFFGWEGVGLSSYLLIGFWNTKHAANAAAIKAFVVNRVGDLGLILGIIAIYLSFGTLDFVQIFDSVESHADDVYSVFGQDIHALSVICLLLIVGAVGKSAQLGLHTWLPDAMEGPTPVSALIHAATMVTAGIFLIARFSPLFEYAPDALIVITILGATTAFVSATIALTQFDIKRVIAYSTMSQLGYMFLALGVSAYSAAMFHLVTHAFFKALLFLAAGNVIHALSGEQDMRNMGGLYKKLPVTHGLMWIGALALAGIWPFAGFYSKDIILEAAWADHSWFGHYAYWVGVLTALLTAFYTWRLLFMTFYGAPRLGTEKMKRVHEASPLSNGALMVLALGALAAGSILYSGFVGSPKVSDSYGQDSYQSIATQSAASTDDGSPLSKDVRNDALTEALKEPKDETESERGLVNVWSRPYFWHSSLFVRAENDTVEAAHYVPKIIKLLPLIAGVSGILLAYLLYIARSGIPSILARRAKFLHHLFNHKWYFDMVYGAIFVRGSLFMGHSLSKGDRNIIDSAGPDGVAGFSQRMAKNLSSFQNGFVYHYALVMIVALICLVSWFVFRADPSFYMSDVLESADVPVTKEALK